MPDIDEGQLTTEVSSSAKKRLKWTGWMAFVVFAGVFLPTAAIVVELAVRLFSFVLDPIPTLFHLILLVTVPVSSILTLWVYLRPGFRRTTLVTFLAGLAYGTSIFYSLLFLPISPLGVIGIIVYGLGLLALTPYFALAASWICSQRLSEAQFLNRRGYKRAFYSGTALSIIILAGYFVSGQLTIAGARMAVSENEARSLKGIRLIRTFGSERVLHRACYRLADDLWTNLLHYSNSQERLTPEQARTVYYKVTGRPFNSVPAPRMVGPRARLAEEFEVDEDVGGTAVNGVVKDLSMASSRMDGVIDPDALTSYTEWTLMFRNDSNSMQKEARAEIALPPGSVVSRLTLWVNGEPREAAFAGRGKVRAAYQKVAVVQRRDPVLVTTCGPDRILMQCFPVPVNGMMKVRLGITSPLIPDGTSKGLLQLPRFVERNFKIADDVKHSLLIESPMDIKLKGGSAQARERRNGFFFDEPVSAESGHTLICSRNSNVQSVWTQDSSDPERYAIIQSLKPARQSPPESVVIVVDSSRDMAKYRAEIADALPSLPKDRRFCVLQAGDETSYIAAPQTVNRSNIQEVAQKIRCMRCTGGIDNRDALHKAHRTALDSKGVIVWIHGPQPLSSGPRTEKLLQLWERWADSPTLISVDAVEGHNAILADLEQTGHMESLPRRGTLSEDLKRLFTSWRDGAQTLAVTRERVPLQSAAGIHASSHVARLWAAEEVQRMCRSKDAGKLEETIRFASKYKLVTPLTGAVVLENDGQYTDAGLEPGDSSNVPSVVPEPSGLLTLAAGAALVVGRRLRRRESGLRTED